MEAMKRARPEEGLKDGKKTITFVTGNAKKLSEFLEVMGTELPITNQSVNRYVIAAALSGGVI